jgi:uncharacterized membrane protein required for colicin V production
MSLLVVEILLALVALQRGWRTAPLLLVAFSALALALASKLAALFAPWVGPYFEPEGVALAIAHGLSLLGLVIACWASPDERPTKARKRGPSAGRRTGALYQI